MPGRGAGIRGGGMSYTHLVEAGLDRRSDGAPTFGSSLIITERVYACESSSDAWRSGMLDIPPPSSRTLVPLENQHHGCLQVAVHCKLLYSVYLVNF